MRQPRSPRVRTKPSIRVRNTRKGIEIMKSFYDEMGNLKDFTLDFIKK